MLSIQFFTVLFLLCAPLLAAQSISQQRQRQQEQQQQQAAEPFFFDYANGYAAKHLSGDPQLDFDSSLAFSLPNGGESYQIVVDGHPRHGERPSCSEDELRTLTVNEQSLSLAPHTPTDPDALHLTGTISVHDQTSGKERLINILIDTECFHSGLDESNPVNEASQPHPWKPSTPVLGVSSFLILDVDGKPWIEKSFTVSHRLLNGHVPDVTVFSPNSPTALDDSFNDPVAPDRPLLPFAPTPPENPIQPESPASLSAGSSLAPDSLASHSGTWKSGSKEISRQLRKLERLRNRLDASQRALEEQENLVHSLLTDNGVAVVEKVEPCEIKDPVCIFKSLSRKCREYLNLIFGWTDSGSNCKSLNCYGMGDMTSAKGAKVLASGSDDLKIDTTDSKIDFDDSKSRPIAKTYKPLLSDDGDSDSESFSYVSYADPHFAFSKSSSSPLSAEHKVHAAIGIVASLLCLTCIAGCLHKRCCNPRARAEREARREERRSRKQYRCAARRQAWKDWWEHRNGCLRGRGRYSRAHTSDYEEKRALILQQEAVLENAMQDEIHTLHQQARNARRGTIDDVLSMVEEGRAASPDSEGSSCGSQRSFGRPPSVAETLPPYRSRAGSGRPPSYNEVDQHAGSVVADGFAMYSPSLADDMNVPSDDEARSIRSIASLRSVRTNRSSPASSVVDISPRHSSETLRTERSSV